MYGFMSIGFSRDEVPDHIRVYSGRVARLLFLKKYCEEGHPVLETELNLVEMARSKLQECLMSSRGFEGMLRSRPEVERNLRASVKARLAHHADDPDTLKDLSLQVDALSFDDLFLTPN